MTAKRIITYQPAPPPEKPKEGEIPDKDRLYLDTQRQKADIIINGGSVRSIFLDDLVRIYTTYFEPRYLLQTSHPDNLIAMLKDLYKRYDEFMAAEQAENATCEKKTQ